MSILSALIGTSTVIRHVQHLVVKVAESESSANSGIAPAPVLITGEPGTGKEHIAHAIHEKSVRSVGPFVPVKCGAIAEDLLEAELFGHDKDAFAGVSQARVGRFAMASGGTLFLEEVSKLSPKLQSALLRVIQDGVIQPVGSTESVPVNVRLICSTSVNIDQAVRERLFREDLYYRLAGCAVYIPPLRERREDIAPLVEHFIHKYNSAKSKSIFGISPDAMSALLQHSWAHNITELENLIERIVVLKNSGSVEVCDLPPRLRQLVTDNIDAFYERVSPPQVQPNPRAASQNPSPTPTMPSRHMTNNQNQYRPQQQSPAQSNMNHQMNFGNQSRSSNSFNAPPFNSQLNSGFQSPAHNSNFEDGSEIDQFIKKDIDLGNGIDFYRVVEEFENRLIAEALRRTNHNKNRAAQLLSMNRTTLVEKLKKRAASSSVKVETGRVKRNPAFTIFDGLGNDSNDFDPVDTRMAKNYDNLSDID